MFFVIVGGLIAIVIMVVGAGLIWMLVCEKREEREAKEHLAWVTGLLAVAETGDEVAMKTLYSEVRNYEYEGQLAFHSRIEQMRNWGKALNELESARPRLEKELNAIAAADSTEQKINLIGNFGDWYLRKSEQLKVLFWQKCNFDFSALRTELGELLQKHYGYLHEKAKTDVMALYELRDLVNRTKEYGNLVKMLPREQRLDYPKDWDEIVSSHLHVPTLYDFGVRDVHETKSGKVRDMAAKAKLDGNVILAKKVLAYCNASDHLRDEVGDVLTAQMAAIVAEYHRSLENQPDNQ